MGEGSEGKCGVRRFKFRYGERQRRGPEGQENEWKPAVGEGGGVDGI